jgi:chorismate dehydratase
MRKVITGDGSVTLYSEEYGESYHSISGAVEEAFRKFVEVCNVRDGMRVLDICFGLGYNSLAAVHTADVEIVALEKDRRVLEEIDKIEVPEYLRKDYEKVKKAAKSLSYGKIKIILGDAVKTLKNVDGKFDAVFLDPFSPLKNPELWTKEFFVEIKRKMNYGAILATYSCARKVRENLQEAGFRVEDGPKVGRRGPSTVATS